LHRRLEDADKDPLKLKSNLDPKYYTRGGS
jgi:hypothetical protein